MFFLVALMVFEKHFHFRSDSLSDYLTILNLSSMKTRIQLWRDDLPNKILMLNLWRFLKNRLGQSVAFISKTVVVSWIAIVASHFVGSTHGLNRGLLAEQTFEEMRIHSDYTIAREDEALKSQKKRVHQSQPPHFSSNRLLVPWSRAKHRSVWYQLK